MRYIKLSVALALAACSGKDADSVVGSWQAKNQTVRPKGEEATVVDSTLDFAAAGKATNGTFNERSVLLYPGTGCENLLNLTGTWKDSAVDYTADYQNGTMQMSKCKDEGQNFASRPLTLVEVDELNKRLVGTTATLSGSQLTFYQYGSKLVYVRK